MESHALSTGHFNDILALFDVNQFVIDDLEPSASAYHAVWLTAILLPNFENVIQQDNISQDFFGAEHSSSYANPVGH